MSTSLSPRYQEKNDTASILAQTKIFEEEMVTLRNLYEHEVEELRGKLQEVSLERSRLEIENSKNSRLANDLQDRVNISNQQISRQQQELNDCGRLMAQKDSEIQSARTSAMQPAIALESQQRELDHVRRSYEEINRKLEAEQLRRMEAQEEINRMQQQLSFRDQIHGADTHDLKARLEGSEAMVLALEAKVREMSGGDRNAAEIIQKVKDACDADIRKYQDEVESKYNAGFREFHQQLEMSNSTITSLTNENQELLITVNDLRAQIRSLEVKLSHAEELSRSLQESLDQERFRSRSHLRNMEDKLRQMQDLLIAKVREVDPVSAQGTPMRTEMEALRGMLQDEDKRIEVAQRSQPEISVTSMIPPISSASPLAPIVRSPAHPSELPAGFGQLASPYTGSKPVGPITASPRGFDDSDIGHGRSPDISKLPPRPHSTPVAPLGQGRDYFDSMFNDLKKDTVFTKVHPKSSPPGGRPQWSSTSHDYHIATTSATGNLKILEVNQDGHFVRIFNQATNIDEEIGGYMIQQNVGGHPVAVYRFPPRTRLKAAQTATVWAAVAASTARHNPPTDFLWKEQHKWGTGPECTTILCKANGQAIAWTTAAHRFAKSVPSYDSSDDEGEQNSTDQEKENHRFSSPFGDDTDRQNSRSHSGVTSQEQPQVPFLRREKESPPSLSPDKHPHGGHPGMPTHPQYAEERALIMGNDNSSALRQSRTQNGRPDPLPGTLYAGGARAGSAPLRKYIPANAGTNRLTKSADPVHYGPPSPFTSPLQQRYAKSQYQGMDFMTYPPKVVSPWHSGFGP